MRRAVYAAIVVIPALVAGCGRGGNSSTGTTSAPPSAQSANSGTAATGAGEGLVAASSVESCLERLGYEHHGTATAQLEKSNPNGEKNFSIVLDLLSPKETSFEAGGGGSSGKREVYVDVAQSSEGAAKIASKAQHEYESHTAQESLQEAQGEAVEKPQYKIGARNNVAYVAWTDAALASENVEKCASE